MSRFFRGLFIFTLCSSVMPAFANWQYPGQYQRDSWAGDDGMRFVMSLRGGMAYGKGSIVNDIGGLTGSYVRNTITGDIDTRAWFNAAYPNGNPDYEDAGYGRLGDLPAAENYKAVSFIAGFSAGLTMPDTPQWRVEFGFDHIAEADYNKNPLFDGTLHLTSGYVVDAQSGGVQSSLSTDVYSVMAFYDFFDGIKKPVRTMIPYVGAGVAYADTKTVLQLTDSYGDLSDVYELQNFGIVDEYGVIKFNKSETHSSNFAPILSVGFSYGVNDRVFLDAGLRGMYISKVKWQLTSSDDERRRDWFSAEKMMYITGIFGMRVEF